ncbi:MAG: Asd/ArgC dimerization domain-containing protein [Acidobacteriaceae bacterium]
MVAKVIRGAIVGASTLLGKELAEELNNAPSAAWDLTLLDAEDAGGTITAAGDEALVIQAVSRDAFTGVDVVFFAGEPSTVTEYWRAAQAAGASIVDLTGALEGQPGMLVRSPLVEGGAHPDLNTAAEIAAHPAAVMLAMAAAKLIPLGLRRMAATVLQPASQAGSAGVDEVHQQTVGLLSFQPLKKEIYATQVAFNISASLGEGAKVNLDETSKRIRAQITILAPDLPEPSLAVQLIQAPVFHGYTASVFVELAHDLKAGVVREALLADDSHLREDESPSNETAVGKGDVLFQVSRAGAAEGSAFWLWMAADNLRLAARNAAGCALELVQLRPMNRVQ